MAAMALIGCAPSGQRRVDTICDFFVKQKQFSARSRRPQLNVGRRILDFRLELVTPDLPVGQTSRLPWQLDLPLDKVTI